MDNLKKGDKILFTIKSLGQEECEIHEKDGKLGIYPNCGIKGTLLTIEEIEKYNDMSITKIIKN